MIDFRKDKGDDIDYEELEKVTGQTLPNRDRFKVPATDANEREPIYGKGFNDAEVSGYGVSARSALSVNKGANVLDYVTKILGTTCIANQITITELMQLVKDRGIK